MTNDYLAQFLTGCVVARGGIPPVRRRVRHLCPCVFFLNSQGFFFWCVHDAPHCALKRRGVVRVRPGRNCVWDGLVGGDVCGGGVRTHG